MIKYDKCSSMATSCSDYGNAVKDALWDGQQITYQAHLNLNKIVKNNFWKKKLKHHNFFFNYK